MNIVDNKNAGLLDVIANHNSATRQKLTYEDLVALHRILNTVPIEIIKYREEMESLGEALTALSFGKLKIVVNEIPKVNPNERKYKNRRKW